VSVAAGINVFAAPGISVLGTDIISRAVDCWAHAVTKREIFTKTNKVFFIAELLIH